MKWSGAKKELAAGRNSIQEFTNFRNSAIPGFIDNSGRELLLLFVRIFQKCSQLLDRDKSDPGILQAKPVQITLKSRNKIGSGRDHRRFSGLERNSFRGQDRLKGFTCSGPVMDEKCGFAKGILGSFRIKQAA